MVKIKKQLTSQNVINKVTYGTGNTRKYIVIHETANTSKGANAQAHANLQSNGNSRSASWHYQADDKQVIQSFNDNIKCWHSGSSKYNNESIGIEICVNSDGNYKQAVNNAIELTKQLMKKYNIPTSNVIQHNTASGKDCPRYLRAGNKGITWSQFKAKLTNTSTTTKKPASKPTKKPQSKPESSKKPNMKTNSIVEYLQSVGQPFGFNHRKKLAKKYGIKNYTGSSVQNLMLLDKLRKGNGVKTTTSLNKTTVRYPLPTSTLSRGSKGNAVKKLQRALNKANFKCGKADGVYGEKTEDAVRRFQKVYDAGSNGKYIDGVYGSRTRTRLNKVVNK